MRRGDRRRLGVGGNWRRLGVGGGRGDVEEGRAVGAQQPRGKEGMIMVIVLLL